MVSGASFALGFFVGRTTGKPPVEQIEPAFRVLMEQAAPVEAPLGAAPEMEEPAIKEPKPASPPPDAAAAKKAPGIYSVQTGAFRDIGDAEALQAKLKGGGYDAYLMTAPGADGKTVYRVRVGRYMDRKEADLTALRLKKVEGLDAFATSD